jgi:hypothetical protein
MWKARRVSVGSIVGLYSAFLSHTSRCDDSSDILVLKNSIRSAGKIDRPTIIADYRKLHEKVCSNDRNQVKQLFDAGPHSTLILALTNYGDDLIHGKFERANGSHSRLIQGPKGVGKTSVLKSFEKLCPVLYPDIIPVYISFDETNENSASVITKDLREILIAHVNKALDIDVRTFDGKNLYEKLVNALFEKNKFVFIMVDEIDQLYRCLPSDTEANHSLLHLS